ncbi:hypothetical protein ACN4D7_00295 [Corynebacterium macclintockiae]|uniref:hypothetical protein n=1 Tax=Corynebacterium macclintockiae TaxID=2913501 RepID=UPI003EB9CD8C
MTRSKLTLTQAHTARKLARDGVSIMRISTVLNKPYVDVFAAVRGVDYPHPVMGLSPVLRKNKDGDLWP